MSDVKIPGLGNLQPAADTESGNVQPTAVPAVPADEMAVDNPPSPPSLTSGLEALLGGLDPLPEPVPASSEQSKDTTGALPETNNTAVSETENPAQASASQEAGNDNVQEEHPEWEVDSSPYESSSDSSSSDDSDEDSDDEKDYKILGPEETARILMEMDGGSDDEGDGKGKGSSSGMVRTKNELPEAIVPRPEVEIKPEMEIVELGSIEHFVGNTAVIKANTDGEYQVLDTGSVLCLADRTVIAAVADVIAAVREPRYTAGFQNEEEIKSFGLETGTKIFYPPALASLGFTEMLKANKGTDASNWHDEEVAEDEIEFSDDEKEAEHKRQLKAKKRGARGGREGAASRGGRNDAIPAGASMASAELKYDDNDDDDGPYRPLARPVGFGQNQASHGSSEPPSGFSGHSGGHWGNRGDFRGRGSRGRGGRGNRGGNVRGGYSLPPRPQGQDGQGAQSYHQQQPPAQQYSLPPMVMGGQPFTSLSPPQPNAQQPHGPANQQFPFPWPQNAQPGFYPPPPPQFTGQSGANGMYLPPNFLTALQNQMQAQQNQQNNQWPGPHGQHNTNSWPGQGGHG
ncbi:Gar1/Naf1 RNA binding region-domain-containing protein [Xylaria bambusicola]|uniref:Gar1/Naf1 RNA binding region-domain-containing protein n=1 Tax=Xylaria bambusicola TaxID=326684 RepID=UPI002008D86C|nr:Gar1/Naf1 RNA binding region-domain-containing protein [Xylaria bambusicola]KAI0508795.1 Gar1/Naf1 RNA binding region-domain-containing protein [Xylaria bambusicola]